MYIVYVNASQFIPFKHFFVLYSFMIFDDIKKSPSGLLSAVPFWRWACWPLELLHQNAHPPKMLHWRLRYASSAPESRRWRTYCGLPPEPSAQRVPLRDFVHCSSRSLRQASLSLLLMLLRGSGCWHALPKFVLSEAQDHMSLHHF